MSETLTEQIMRHESLRLKPYHDTEGVLTIGYGRNLEQGITNEEARYLLENDIATHATELKRKFPVVMDLTPERRNVLINMAFNLGVTRLGLFRRMWAAIRLGQYDTAAEEMLNSKWASQVGSRAVELAKLMRG